MPQPILKTNKVKRPSGSICFSGFNVSRPYILAVGSPSLSATRAWANSWMVIDRIRIRMGMISIFKKETYSVIITAMRTCSLCSKKPQVGRNRSHAQNRSPRTFKANVQKVSIKVGDDKLSGVFCAKCIKKIRGELKEKR